MRCCAAGWCGKAAPVEQEVEAADARDEDEAIGRRRGWLCVALGAVGAMQLAAVTGHLTENVAALPLLWVLPLAVYLLSFVVSFELPGLYRRALVVRLLVVMLASLGYLLSKTDVSLPIGIGIGFFLLELFAACWFCAAEIYALRPTGGRAAARFYLLLAAGGAGGTALVAIGFPLIFQGELRSAARVRGDGGGGALGDVAGWRGAARAVGGLDGRLPAADGAR